MAKSTIKKPVAAVSKGPPGLTSLTVLFFEGQPCFLGTAAEIDATMLGLRSATARYVEVKENDWVLKMTLRPRGGKVLKVILPMVPESLRPVELLSDFLGREIMIQARLEAMSIRQAMQFTDDEVRLIASDTEG